MKHLHQFSRRNRPEVIGWFDDFDGEHPYRALSNFYIGEPIEIPEIEGAWMTGEHAYQALKAASAEERERIRRANSPAQSKMLGNTCQLRSDWEAVKYDAMMAVLRAKFTLGREEGRVLRATGDALLIEGTFWQDTVWGVDLRDDTVYATHAPGRNWLGTMLMARRAELKAESLYNRHHPTGIFNALFAR